MAKEGSVAPKERVNIVYRPATGDAKEEIELPLKLLVIGDFTQRPDDRMVEERERRRIERFSEVRLDKGLRAGSHRQKHTGAKQASRAPRSTQFPKRPHE